MIKGSCLCGAVRYRLDEPPEVMNLCHCRMCRKATGSSYGVFAHTSSDKFHWLAGEANVSRFESSPGNYRSFCSICGSNVPVIETDGSVIVPAGTFDDDPGARPALQIFAASKAPWHELADHPVAFNEFEPDDFFDD
ncbi:MAG TPA: GFA family protein [Arenicellales bacterium]|nr:GFA family protein [Arenicellales bacterium]